MKYFDKQTAGHLLKCVNSSDEKKFIDAYNKMVDALNAYEIKIREQYPEFDISKVLDIQCQLDIVLSKRTFRIEISIKKVYPYISEEDAIKIEKRVMLIIDEILMKYGQ
jgi:hypothetical protein